MEHNFPLITTLAAGFGIALVLGFVAERVKLPALVGYLIAGIIIGPATPGFVADVHIASQLSEIGVMLLMFGVGLHFSVQDLMAVKGIAVPGALVLRLMLVAALAVALSGAVAAWLVTRASGQEAMRRVVSQQTDEVEVVARLLASKIEQSQKVLRTVAAGITPAVLESPSSLEWLLQQGLPAVQFFDTMQVARDNGELRLNLRAGQIEKAADLDPAERDALRRTLVDGKPLVSELIAGRRGEARIGATLHKRVDLRRWIAFIRNGKRLRTGDVVEFPAGVSALAEGRHDDGSWTLTFAGEEPVEVLLERAGQMPLPPYIAGKRGTDEDDLADYQTIFANEPGAVAAPTAALHFTPELLAALDDAGIVRETLTLHVGAGTFLPVKVDDTAAHQMHAEWGRIEADVADRLNAARRAGGRVIAVGTTSLRLLESATGEDNIVRPFASDTSIFITPGYRFRAIDGLMTNFHLPKSTLFMLVSALMGLERMQAIYSHAIAGGYRFFSYGGSGPLVP